MTKSEKVERLKSLVDEQDESVLVLYLDIAESKILEKLYPLATDRSTYMLPDFYNNKQILIAMYLCENKGVYGLTSHTEQGVTDTFSSADIPTELTSDIIPYASLPSGIVKKGT